MSGIETLASYVILPVLVLSAALAAVRLFRGPSLPDRVVALDLMSTIGIAIVAVFALAFDRTVFFDIAVVIAMVSFMATVAFAKYMEKRVQQEAQPGADTASDGKEGP